MLKLTRGKKVLRESSDMLFSAAENKEGTV